MVGGADTRDRTQNSGTKSIDRAGPRARQMEGSRPSLYLHVPTLLSTAPEYCWMWYKNSNNDGDYSDDNGYGDGDNDDDDDGDGKYRAKELGRDRATILGVSQDLSLKPSTTCTSFQMFYTVPHTLTTA